MLYSFHSWKCCWRQGRPRGGAIRQFFSRPTPFCLIYMTRKGRESYRKPPPLRMRVSVNVWHSNESSCWILWFIGITLGITGSQFVSPLMKLVTPAEIGECNFSSFVITSVSPKTSQYTTKNDCIFASWHYLFCLLVPGVNGC